MGELYTDEQKDFIRMYGADFTTKELHELLNTRFGCNHSLGSVRTTTKRLGVLKTKDTISRCHKKPKYEVGDSRIINGYEYIKISNTSNGFYNQWKRKCRIVWEEHNGKIPDKHQVVFLNRDTLDCRIENLACIPFNICARMANGHGKAFWSEFPEVTKTALLVCELDETIQKGVIHMANAKKCDRCGNFYDKNLKYRGRNSTNEFIDGVTYTTTEGNIKSQIDLCDDCLTDLYKFLGGTKLASDK